MSTLHIISASPFSTGVLQRCLNVCAPGDAILFIQNGVYIVQNPGLLTGEDWKDEGLTDRGTEVYVLTEDLDARGLTVGQRNLQPISYDGFVTLVCRHRNSINWY
tara:strand:- start:16715 stop:17029 length:315 start_codon:yes stop_codon:yes gene_type:complete